jgi:hypothetical protein
LLMHCVVGPDPGGGITVSQVHKRCGYDLTKKVMIMATVNSTVRPRRVVRRRARPAIDVAIDTALADFDPAMRPAIIA